MLLLMCTRGIVLAEGEMARQVGILPETAQNPASASCAPLMASCSMQPGGDEVIISDSQVGNERCIFLRDRLVST